MKENIFIYDGNGKIKIKGGISDTFFFIKNKPKIASFYAELGTIWRFFVGTSITEKIFEDNYKYENLVSSGNIDLNNILKDQFAHILSLLSNGNYELEFCDIENKFCLIELKKDEKSYYEAYGHSYCFIYTQNYLDLSIVESYKSKILKGDRPIVVLFKLQKSEHVFVIDGHHKLSAYNELNIKPKALIISKIENTEVDVNSGIEIMKELGLNEEIIINFYKQEKSNLN